LLEESGLILIAAEDGHVVLMRIAVVGSVGTCLVPYRISERSSIAGI
jgi:hypothetical protein